MNRKIIFYVKELLVTQMNHWALLPLLLVMIVIAKNAFVCDDPSLWIWLLMGAVPFVFYFLRIYFRRFFLLLGSHLFVLALLFLLLPTQTSQARGIYLFMGVSYTTYSISQRLRSKDFQDEKIFMPVAVGLAAVSAFFVHYLGFDSWDSHLLLALIAVFGLHFLSSYLEGYLYFITVNESSTGHIPEREIFLSGSRLMVIFVLFSMAILFLSSHLEWLGTVISLLRAVIYAVIRLIAAVLPKGEPDAPPMDASPMPGDWGMVRPDAGEPFLFWVILENLLIIVVFCGLAYLILRLLFRLIRFVRDRMKRKRSVYAPQTWESVYDVREKCALERTKKKDNRTLFSRMSPEERVRRLYRNYIAGAVKRLSLTPDSHEEADPALRTAREWGTLLNREDIAPLYEKARYSKEGVTTEELRRMKDICKGKVTS